MEALLLIHKYWFDTKTILRKMFTVTPLFFELHPAINHNSASHSSSFMATSGEPSPDSRSDNSQSRSAFSNVVIFSRVFKKNEISRKCQLLETTKPDRTFPWYYHFAILLALSKSSTHYLEQSCHSLDHFSILS